MQKINKISKISLSNRSARGWLRAILSVPLRKLAEAVLAIWTAWLLFSVFYAYSNGVGFVGVQGLVMISIVTVPGLLGMIFAGPPGSRRMVIQWSDGPRNLRVW